MIPRKKKRPAKFQGLPYGIPKRKRGEDRKALIATDPADLITHIADLLNCLWVHSDRYGGHDYHTIFCNALYMAKPE